MTPGYFSLSFLHCMSFSHFKSNIIQMNPLNCPIISDADGVLSTSFSVYIKFMQVGNVLFIQTSFTVIDHIIESLCNKYKGQNQFHNFGCLLLFWCFCWVVVVLFVFGYPSLH